MNQTKQQERQLRGATAGTSAVVGMEQETVQLAYTMGGATIRVADIEDDNADYTAGKNKL